MGIYSPVHQTWVPGPPLRHARGFAAVCCVETGTEEALYIIGGDADDNDPIDSVEVLEIGNGALEWYEVRTLQIARSGVAVVVVGNEVYAVGGIAQGPNREQEAVNITEIY